jgi:hypothetical protein
MRTVSKPSPSLQSVQDRGGTHRQQSPSTQEKEYVMNKGTGRAFRRALIGAIVAAALLLPAAGPVAAHAHYAENGQAGDGQVLANGQNHPRFLPNGDGTFSSCESYGPVPGSSIGNAWYGLETATTDPTR